MDQDRPTYTPSAAGNLLQLSKRRVLQMLERGELAGDQDPDTGRWSIPVSHVEDLRRRREREQREKPPREGSRDTVSADRELVDVLRDQVEDLRHRLDREQEANRENRRIIAGLTSRIPELEAPAQERSPEPRESSEKASPTRTPTEGPADPQTATSKPSRPLWRRLLGG